MTKVEPLGKLSENTPNSRRQTISDTDQKPILLKPMQAARTPENMHSKSHMELGRDGVQWKRKPGSMEGKPNLQAVEDMISRALVEPDVVSNIYRRLDPRDVMNLEMGLPGLANLLHRLDVDPTVQANQDVRFDLVRWRQNPSSPLEEVLQNCDRDDEGSFVRVRLDGTHVTAFDVNDRWIALGYYSGAFRLFDRESLSFKKLMYNEKDDVDRYSSKISRIWISEGLVITLDTRNNLVQRTLAEPDSPTKHILGDTLQHLVFQGNVCLQAFEKQENFDLLVCHLNGRNMTIIKEIIIPKIVTNNIMRVSLNVRTKQMLVYYEEEIIDYKTWRTDIFDYYGYYMFPGQQRHADHGARAQFLAILDYVSGAVIAQHEINPKNEVLGPNSGLKVLTKVGEGVEANLWKLLSPSINGVEGSLPNQVILDPDCDSLKLRQFPRRILHDILTIPTLEEMLMRDVAEGKEGHRNVDCKLVTETVFYDERSLIFHSQDDVVILDLWERGWKAEADVIESSGDSGTEVTEESDESKRTKWTNRTNWINRTKWTNRTKRTNQTKWTNRPKWTNQTKRTKW